MATRPARRRTRAKAPARGRRNAPRKRVKRTVRGRASARSARKVRRTVRKRAAGARAKARAAKPRRRAAPKAASPKRAPQTTLGSLTPPIAPPAPPRTEPIHPSPWAPPLAEHEEDYGPEGDEESM
jgi:hypothetical protein